MKSLTLLRHAKSGWDVPVARDFDRPINARGRRAATLVGQHWASLGAPLDGLVASPAVRVNQTLDLFLPAAGIETMARHHDQRLYLASAATILNVVRETDDAHRHMLLAGHNPGLEDLVLMLVPAATDDAEQDERRALIAEKLPTATLVRLEVDVRHWCDVDGETEARLTHVLRPRDLDASLGPDGND